MERNSGSRPRRSSKAPTEQEKIKPKDKKPKKKAIEFQLPPLSVVGKKKEIDFELIRKKVIRRGNPEGEDRKQLVTVLKHLRDSKSKIRVYEFVNLVGKHTCDNGECMRKILEDDLASFRKIVTKVYENMTQDVSDVLVNEQIQTNNFYEERCNIYNEKMVWMVNQILQLIPEFDFEKYAKDGQRHLDYICPMPSKIPPEDADLDMLKRQEAFHRLQWLKIEEKRLAEENKRLDRRLEEVKKQHERESTQANMKSKIMERKMHDLVDKEQEKQHHLTELEDLLGKNIVRTEAYIRLEGDEKGRLVQIPPKVDEKALRKAARRQIRTDRWSVETAIDMEVHGTKKVMDSEGAIIDEHKRMRRRQREPDKESTLFDRSQPPKRYSEVSSLRRIDQKTVTKSSTSIQEKRPKRGGGGGGGCSGGCGR